MSIALRQAAAVELLVTAFNAIQHSQGPPQGYIPVGLAFLVAFVILEFKAGWHILWKHHKMRGREAAQGA